MIGKHTHTPMRLRNCLAKSHWPSVVGGKDSCIQNTYTLNTSAGTCIRERLYFPFSIKLWWQWKKNTQAALHLGGNDKLAKSHERQFA